MGGMGFEANKGQSVYDIIVGFFLLIISILVGGALTLVIKALAKLTEQDILLFWTICSILIFAAELAAWFGLIKKYAENL